MSEMIIDLFPSDIKAEIFSHLPVDSIIQCKHVCKTWRILIDELFNNPCFINMHTLRFLSSPSSADAFPYSFLRREKSASNNINDWNVVGSCNGLVCLVKNPKGLQSLNVYICNPVTRECTNLPRQIDSCPSLWLVSSIVATGFGYCPCTKEYKFVRITGIKKMSISIYILGSGTWRMKRARESGGPVHLDAWQRGAAPSLLSNNGALYWSKTPCSNIFLFDLKTEEFRIVPSPPQSNENVDEIGVLGGCFCMLRTKGVLTKEIWVLNKRDEYYYTWTKKCSIQAMLINNITLEEKIVSGYDYMKVVSYDDSKTRSHDQHLNNNTMINPQMVHWINEILPYTSKFEMIPYTRSLVSLRALGETADDVATRKRKRC